MLVQHEHKAMLRDQLVDPFHATFTLLGGTADCSRSSANGDDGRNASGTFCAPMAVPPRMPGSSVRDPVTPIDEAVDYIVDECFLAVGQAVGDRKALDAGAVIWWRDHYRARFLATMQRFGNRWQADQKNVKAVARMLAERAVEYAAASPSIDERSARKATADVERYCSLHAARRQRAESGADVTPWMAGYWCEGELPLAV